MRRGRTAARRDSGRTHPQDEPGQQFDDGLQSHVIGGRDRTSGRQSTVSALFLLALNLGKRAPLPAASAILTSEVLNCDPKRMSVVVCPRFQVRQEKLMMSSG